MPLGLIGWVGDIIPVVRLAAGRSGNSTFSIEQKMRRYCLGRPTGAFTLESVSPERSRRPTRRWITQEPNSSTKKLRRKKGLTELA